MKKRLQPLLLATLALPTFVFANSTAQVTSVEKVQAATGSLTAQAEIKNETTPVISPRTGIRYTLGNTGGRPIILKTSAIAAATPTTVNRVIASNPALSPLSQEKVKRTLLAFDSVQ